MDAPEKDDDKNSKVLSKVESHRLVLIALAGGLAMFSILVILSEPFRYTLFHHLAPHYSRLTEDRIEQDITQQNIRGLIYKYINDNPGSKLSTIKEETKAGYGTTVYHLSVLQREGYIRSATKGREKLFWMKQEFPAVEEASLTESQKSILELLEKCSELSRAEICEKANISMTTVHNNIKELKKRGRVREEKRGKQYLCSLDETQSQKDS